MSPHQPCSHCHTSIAVTRFEVAHDAGHTYWVCPECDEIVALVADVPSDNEETGAVEPVTAPHWPQVPA